MSKIEKRVDNLASDKHILDKNKLKQQIEFHWQQLGIKTISPS